MRLKDLLINRDWLKVESERLLGNTSSVRVFFILKVEENYDKRNFS